MGFEIDGVGPLAVVGVAVVGVALTLVGGGILVSHTATMGNVESTEGTVTNLWIGETTDPDGVTDYYPRIEYRYTVDGTRYTNTNYSLGSRPTFDSRSEVQGVVESYGLGENVTVYYDATDPSNSFIKNETPMYSVALVLSGLFLMLVSGRLLYPHVESV